MALQAPIHFCTNIDGLGVCLIVAWAVMFLFFRNASVSVGQSVMKRNCSSFRYFYGLLVFGLSRCNKPHVDVQLHKGRAYFALGFRLWVSNASGRGEIKSRDVGRVGLVLSLLFTTTY